MKKTLLIIMFISIGLTISLIFAWSYQSINSPSIEPTQEYQNEQFGYSLKYSPFWKLNISENSPVGHIKLVSTDIKGEGDKIISGAFIDVFALTKEPEKTLKVWLSESDLQNNDIPIIFEEEISLNDYKGIKRIVGTVGDINNQSYDIYLTTGDKVYEIAGNVSSEKQSEIDKILKSFEILN